MRTLAIGVLLSAAGVRALAAQAQFAAPTAIVRTDPATPARGSAAWLSVDDDPSSR